MVAGDGYVDDAAGGDGGGKEDGGEFDLRGMLGGGWTVGRSGDGVMGLGDEWCVLVFCLRSGGRRRRRRLCRR